MQRERALGRAGDLYESGVRRQCLLGCVLARGETVQRSHPSDVRDEWPVAERYRLPERVQRRCVLRHMHSWCDAMQSPNAADLRRYGYLG
jgi:hypothetical protein